MDTNLLKIISKESNDSVIPQKQKNKYNISKPQNDYKLGTTIAPRVSYIKKK